MNSDWRDARVFSHEAMGTIFRIGVIEADVRYARQAASAAFEELDHLEGLLSRYVESSDVSRINHSPQGRWTVVALDTLRCLQIALNMRHPTGGAFDVAYASRSRTGPATCLEIDPRTPRVRALAPGVEVDLGGIGKGYALDRMASLLREWDLRATLFQASTSTLLAGNEPQNGWPIAFGPSHDRIDMTIQGRAVSASGKAVKGDHVRDPRSGDAAVGAVRCWASASSAAVADAWSTALLVLPVGQARVLCSRHKKLVAFVLPTEDAQIIRIG